MLSSLSKGRRLFSECSKCFLCLARKHFMISPNRQFSLNVQHRVASKMTYQKARFLSLRASAIFIDKHFPCIFYYSVSADVSHTITEQDGIECSDIETRNLIRKDVQVISDFVTEDEEKQLFEEVEPYLERSRYQTSHWDDAIHGYRETERKIWTAKNKEIIERVKDIAFPPGTPHLAHVHVLDLQKDGYIKPHIDAVKFCGNTIAGISLLSPAVMRFVHSDDKTKSADVFLDRRSLYIMKDSVRYNYTHEVLPDQSKFKGRPITKDRRISVICRNEPEFP